MSNAFLNGMRSAAYGGNVRTADMRSADQNQSQSGNPRTPFNTSRAVRPMWGQQQQQATPMPKQYIAPQPGQPPTQQQLYQAQQQGSMGGTPNANLMGQMYQGSPQGQMSGTPNPNLMGQMQSPQWNTPGGNGGFAGAQQALQQMQNPVAPGNGGGMSQAQQALQQYQGPQAMAGNGNGFATNLNTGRFGYNRPRWQ